MITTVVGALDGYLFSAPCSDKGTGFDCTNTGCTDGSAKTTTKDFKLGGTAGKFYNVTFNVKGIVEAKIYNGGTRRAGTTMNYVETGSDFWHEGGTVRDSSYNTYELHVTPAVSGVSNDYFLNSRVSSSSENHESWVLGYTSTIKVPANGNINFRVYDKNCRQIMNCGPGVGGSTCKSPTTMNLASAMPQPTISQPYLGNSQMAPGQWVFIDVTKVEEAP